MILDGSAPAVGTRSASTQEHRAQAMSGVECAVLTVSDTRTLEDDRGGALVIEILGAHGHSVCERAIVADDVAAIRGWARQVLERGVADAIVVTGGSGIGPRDVSPQALRPLLSSEVPGFGEVFRALSWNEVGAATILSRALCGVAEWFAVGQTPRRVVVWVLPGSTNAVRLALEKVIAPELGHLAREVRGRGASGGPQAGAST